MKLETSQLDLTAVGFSLTNARLCLQAAADAYVGVQASACPGSSVNAELQPDQWITNTATDTHVLIRDLGDALVVSFRGSASLRNWLTDFDAHKQAIAISHIHAGFYHAALSVRDELRDAIAKSNCRVVFITGHSLGGALAVVASWMLSKELIAAELIDDGTSHLSAPPASPLSTINSPAIIHSIYTFGQPRVGDAAFAADNCLLITDYFPLSSRLFRITNRADLVPWVPGYLMGYRHFGNHIHCDALGLHENFPLTAELLGNGLEIYREFRRGQCALLADHAVAEYQQALR